MLILGLDFEMLGLDPSQHAICEVGAQLWDTKQHRAVMSMGYLIQVPGDSPYEEEALKTSGLTLDLLTKYGKDSIRGLKQLLNMYDQADVICAHNGNRCDRAFFRSWMKACDISEEEFPDNKVWIDTMVDIEFPRNWNRQLTCLAAYHGFLNPFPHQALSDVMTMLRIVDSYPLEPIIESASTPVVAIRLMNIPYDDRDWAKARGYFPHRSKTTGKFLFWMKLVKENKLEQEIAEAVEAKYGALKLDEIPEGAI